MKMRIIHKYTLLVTAIFLSAAQPVWGKTVRIRLGEKGLTAEAPEEAHAGDTIQIVVPGKTWKVIYQVQSRIPDMSHMYSGLSCSSAAQAGIATKRSDEAVVYLVCDEKSRELRKGIVILGPHRKVLYLAYSPYSDPSNPIHLAALGDAPVLTTQDEPFIVIVNKRASDLPVDFDLTYSVKQGSFIDVAPVRPTTTQSNAKKAAGEEPSEDYLLRFQKKFLGEQIVDYDVSGYFPAQTEDKTTETTDAAGKKTSTTEVITEYAQHKIFSGELPQVHSLYYYNIATGVVASFLRDPTYARVLTQVKTDDAHPALYKTEQQPGSDRAFPVLMFSAYLVPMDAQVPWRPKDLIPAPTVGFSLSTPADDFFFGASMEVRRHVQLVTGYHLGRIKVLPPTQGIDDPTSSAAPVTASHFRGNFFVGATFNIDFIKGLFK